MKSRTALLPLGAWLVLSPLSAEAQPLNHRHHTAAKAAVAPVAARHAAIDRFSARMSRLDALMGSERTTRTRSANALTNY